MTAGTVKTVIIADGEGVLGEQHVPDLPRRGSEA